MVCDTNVASLARDDVSLEVDGNGDDAEWELCRVAGEKKHPRPGGPFETRALPTVLGVGERRYVVDGLSVSRDMRMVSSSTSTAISWPLPSPRSTSANSGGYALILAMK